MTWIASSVHRVSLQVDRNDVYLPRARVDFVELRMAAALSREVFDYTRSNRYSPRAGLAGNEVPPSFRQSPYRHLPISNFEIGLLQTRPAASNLLIGSDILHPMDKEGSWDALCWFK